MRAIARLLALLVMCGLASRPSLGAEPIAPALNLNLNMPAGVDPPADQIFYDGDSIPGNPVFNGKSLLDNTWEFHIDPDLIGVADFEELDLLFPFVSGVTISLVPPSFGYTPWTWVAQNTPGGVLVRCIWQPGAGRLGQTYIHDLVLWGAMSASIEGGDSAGIQQFLDTPVTTVAYFHPQAAVPEPGPLAAGVAALLAVGSLAFAARRRPGWAAMGR